MAATEPQGKPAVGCFEWISRLTAAQLGSRVAGSRVSFSIGAFPVQKSIRKGLAQMIPVFPKFPAESLDLEFGGLKEFPSVWSPFQRQKDVLESKSSLKVTRVAPAKCPKPKPLLVKRDDRVVQRGMCPNLGILKKREMPFPFWCPFQPTFKRHPKKNTQLQRYPTYIARSWGP